MALPPDRRMEPATTGSDGVGDGRGPEACAHGRQADALQKQREERSRAHKRRLAIENDAFHELAEMLPVRRPLKGFADKLTALRLAIAFMKVSKLYRRDPTQDVSWSSSHQWEPPELLTDALSGFVFILDGNGWILYMSSSVSKHLGHSATEMMGKNIRNYLHSEDMAELASLLRQPVRGLTAQGDPCRLLLRVTNCLRRWRVGSNASSNRYSVVLCSGYRRLCQLTEKSITEDNRSNNILLLASGYTLPHACFPQCQLETDSGVSVRSSLTFLGQRNFVFRSSLDLTPFYVEAAVRELTEYETFTFSHYSLYHFVHPCDVETVRRSHKDVLAKGHSLTGYYRLLVQSGGWIWMQSHFTLIHAVRAARNKFILAVNCAISNVEKSSSEFLDVRYPNQFLLPRKGSGALDRNKGKESSSRERNARMKSSLKNAMCYRNPDLNALLGSSSIHSNNGLTTELALSNLMQLLGESGSCSKEETHLCQFQSQREVDKINNNDSRGRVSINTAGLSGGTVHQNLLGAPQKLVRRDRGRKLTRQLARIAGPKDWRPHHIQHQTLKSLTWKFFSEATPFTDDDSNLMPDTDLLGAMDQLQHQVHLQVGSSTPVQNYSAAKDTHGPCQCRSSFGASRLPTRDDMNLWQVSKQSSCRDKARMDHGSGHAAQRCHNTLQQSLIPTQTLHSGMENPLQAEDLSTRSTIKSKPTSYIPFTSCPYESGF